MAPEQYRGAQPDHLGIRASRLPPGGYEASMNVKGPRAEWRHAQASPNWIDLPYREARAFEGAINRERDALGLRARSGSAIPTSGRRISSPPRRRRARRRGCAARVPSRSTPPAPLVADTEYTGSWCSIRRRHGQDLGAGSGASQARSSTRAVSPLDRAGTRSRGRRGHAPILTSAAPQLACLARRLFLSGTHRFLRRTPLGVFLSRAAARTADGDRLSTLLPLARTARDAGL